MLTMIKFFVNLYPLTTILAVLSLAVVGWIAVKLILLRRTEMLRTFSVTIDWIPLFAGLVAVSGFLSELYFLNRAIASIDASGAPDPRVIAAGFHEIFFTMTVIGVLFFIFLEMWLVARMIHGYFLRELDDI